MLALPGGNMGHMKRYLVVALLVVVSGVSPVYADIYSFVDDQGTVHLSNVPSDTRYSLTLHEATPLIANKPAKTNQADNYAAHKQPFALLVKNVAREHHVEPALLRAVITVESSFNPHAVSDKGAVGLMQIMPNIARRYGVSDRYDPIENVQAGASYLRDLLQRFDGDVQLAVAAYNAGEEAVARNGNHIPRNHETPSYVLRVMQFYRRYQAEYE